MLNSRQKKFDPQQGVGSMPCASKGGGAAASRSERTLRDAERKKFHSSGEEKGVKTKGGKSDLSPTVKGWVEACLEGDKAGKNKAVVGGGANRRGKAQRERGKSSPSRGNAKENELPR